MTDLQRTPLYEIHRKAGAKLVPFAGFEMPVQYSGIIEEHTTVRRSMGLFDVSHMGEIEVRGKRALDFCQKVSTNDASTLKPGKVQYSTILNAEGGILDDCTLYRFHDDHFLFIVNAASREKIVRWFNSHAMDGASVEDRSEEYALLALQGRKAEALLSRLLKRDLRTVRFYEFGWFELLGSALLISRTGYTGEDGFEIYVAPDRACEVWALLMKEGAADGLLPVGLGARDTLRLEMGYLLYGNDMTEGMTPLEAGLGWVVKLNKGAFLGRERLVQQKADGLRQRIRAFAVSGRRIPRPQYEIRAGGKRVGEVTSGTFSPSLKIGIGLGTVEASLKIGSPIEVVVRGKGVSAEVIKPPFVEGSIRR